MTDRPTILIDLEGVIVESRPGRERPAFSMRPGAEAGLERLAEITPEIVGLIQPAPPGSSRKRGIDRLAGVRAPMTRGGPEIRFVACPHGDTACDCRPPSPGLALLALGDHPLSPAGGWHISGESEGVVAGRAAGLRTVRIGPRASDPEAAVHRADYEARDLLDAANWILVQSLGTPAS
jgi:D-glycero-D-manno-heptose 1,7-bisphosphate phosphatase